MEDQPSSPATSDALLRGDPLRAQLRVITIAWLFGSFWLATINGAALTQFQIAMGTPQWAFGLLAALPYIAYLFQLPAVYLQGRLGCRKRLFIVTVVFGRLMWTAAAAVPWVLPNAPQWWWPLMAVALFLGWAGNQAGSPAWIDWMADVVPHRVRGRYFSMRMRLGQAITFVTTVTIGGLLSLMENDGSPGIMLKICSMLLALAGLMGALDIFAFERVHDPYKPDPKNTLGLMESLRQVCADRQFMRYIGFVFTLYLAIGFIQQYIWLYVLQEIRFSPWSANIMLIAVPVLMQLLTYGMWGRLIDRLGRKPVLLISGAVVINGVWGWILVGHGGWMFEVYGMEFSALSIIGYGVAVVAMLAWPGTELAMINIVMSVAGTRDGRRNGNAYAAVNSLAVASGGMLSGLLGAYIAAAMPDLHWVIPVLGVPLTYHGVLFLLSGCLRVIAFAFILSMAEPRAARTRDAMRYVTFNLYSNAVEVMSTMPGRIVSRAAKLGFRMNTPPRPRDSQKP